MEKRLQNILAHNGIASRRHAAELIESGKVKVDGCVVQEKGFRLDPDDHKITVNNKPLKKQEKKYYFLFNKPADVISTVSDTHDRKKITDFFKHIKARLYPVGRLDKDTKGAIIITNDGDFANRLSHPRFNVDKEYLAEAGPFVSKEQIQILEKGIEFEEGMTGACTIELVRRTETGAVYKIKIHEGRKRQIKRMFEFVDARVYSLKRTKYAGLSLKGLAEGRYRELTDKEIERLKK
ncbi:MAG: pseudouridine synthase [Candidatus Omnitrophota bacterium]